MGDGKDRSEADREREAADREIMRALEDQGVSLVDAAGELQDLIVSLEDDARLAARRATAVRAATAALLAASVRADEKGG